MRFDLRIGGGLVTALIALVLGGPLAAESQGTIPAREKKATFKMKAEVSQSTNWRDYRPNSYDGCTGELYNYDSDGAQALLARAREPLRFRDFGGLITVESKPDAQAGLWTDWSNRVPFEVDVARAFNESTEIIAPGGESACGSCPPEGCGESDAGPQNDCGERSTLGIALVGHGFAVDADGREQKDRLSFEDEAPTSVDYSSEFAPYTACPLWGPEGLMPLHDKLKPSLIFGKKKKLVLRGKTIERESGDNPESYSETIQEWKIVLKRKK